ncbi:MAG: hypothetical protein U0105_27595 [Candidatus Obscuribacterales bacterium]
MMSPADLIAGYGGFAPVAATSGNNQSPKEPIKKPNEAAGNVD